jgi:hypothetical protein
VGECIIIHEMRVCICATGLPVGIYLVYLVTTRKTEDGTDKIDGILRSISERNSVSAKQAPTHFYRAE